MLTMIEVGSELCNCKCGTQLIKEAMYKSLEDDEDLKKKAKMVKGSKHYPSYIF